MRPLDTNALTWTALLSKWVEFAQSTLALPDDAEGDRWRQSAAPIIHLQAVTFALRDLEQLPSAERAYARDKADVMIEEQAVELERIWSDGQLPEMVIDVLADADEALEEAAWLGLMELIWRGDRPMLVPEFTIDQLLQRIGGDTDKTGTFAIAQPGTYIMPGEPIAWWCDLDHAAAAMTELFPGGESAPATFPRQVYRDFAENGRIERDVIARADDDREEIEGLPLLIPIIAEGKLIGSFTLDAAQWEEAQRHQIGERAIEVVDLTQRAGKAERT